MRKKKLELGDLFSTFNPIIRIFYEFGGNWLSVVIPLVLIPQSFWLVGGQPLQFVVFIIKSLLGELKAAITGLVPGVLIVPLRFFFFLVGVNFIGLFPYVFTGSSHLRFTLRLALPLWLGSVLYRLVSQFNLNMAHLVPEGTPGALISLIVLIERVRLLIRPVALAVRLAANMVAGHLLLVLLGGQGVIVRFTILLFLLVGIGFLVLLECAVACIQAYVFTILRSLYLNDHTSKKILLVGDHK